MAHRPLLLATLLLTSPALAEDGAPTAPPPAAAPPAAATRPPLFVAVMGGSTLAYRPSGGELLGPQKDVVPGVGVGVGVSETVWLELDVTATWAAGALGPPVLVPGINWYLGTYVFTAGRLAVPLAAGTPPSLLAGLGLALPLGPRFAPVVEADVFLTPRGWGHADVGLSLSVGTTYTF